MYLVMLVTTFNEFSNKFHVPDRVPDHLEFKLKRCFMYLAMYLTTFNAISSTFHVPDQ